MRMTALNGAAAGAMAVALGLGAAACTTPAPGSAPSRTGADDPAARLESLVALDRRVAAVGYRLATASAELCASRRDVAGWTLHAATQYSDALRPAAGARFGLRGDLPGILAVAADSPAARAGLVEGDLLIRLNGQALEQGDTTGVPSHDGLAANVARLDRAMAAGPVILEVRRDGTTRTVTVRPTLACNSFFQVDPSDEYNARADGKGVFISSTMAAYAADDDELAMILGHELVSDGPGRVRPGTGPRLPAALRGRQLAGTLRPDRPCLGRIPGPGAGRHQFRDRRQTRGRTAPAALSPALSPALSGGPRRFPSRRAPHCRRTRGRSICCRGRPRHGWAGSR